jgi:3-methyladenine DNA glycosylase/8-oxoguanine DNA glycosylase
VVDAPRSVRASRANRGADAHSRDLLEWFAVAGPLDLVRTLAPLRNGGGDVRLRRGEVWRASWTAEGPATLRLVQERDGVRAEAWGPGAATALVGVPDLLGVAPEDAGFEPEDSVVRDLLRRHPGVRIPRTGDVVAALVPAIIHQKVVGADAGRSYATLVRLCGEPAPGPVPMTLPPRAATLARTPSWVFHRAGIERRRADTIRRVAAVAPRLEEAVGMPREDGYRRLRAVPGVGEWTAAEAALVAFGDTDAVSVGDYHLPNLVSWMLAGQARGDDACMLELLAPYRPHRARVIRLLELSGQTAPRRGPRMPRQWIADH